MSSTVERYLFNLIANSSFCWRLIYFFQIVSEFLILWSILLSYAKWPIVRLPLDLIWMPFSLVLIIDRYLRMKPSYWYRDVYTKRRDGESLKGLFCARAWGTNPECKFLYCVVLFVSLKRNSLILQSWIDTTQCLWNLRIPLC